ncbi:MAG: hypothetical protein ABSG32_22840 [Terriglobia bacterium]|jgi:hypothetical protein
MLSKLKRLFNRAERSPKFEQRLDDVGLSWLDTPADPLDIAAWDRYWTEQIRHGLGPPLFDMFCNDRHLVEVMNSEGMENVLL